MAADDARNRTPDLACSDPDVRCFADYQAWHDMRPDPKPAPMRGNRGSTPWLTAAITII